MIFSLRIAAQCWGSKYAMCALCRHSARRLGKEQALGNLSGFVRLDASSGWPSSHRLMPRRRALSSPGAMNVFDRVAKRRQKNRAASSHDADTYDYLRKEVAGHIIDRVGDVARFFPLALDLGCGRSHIAMATTSDLTGCLVQCDMAKNALLGPTPSSPTVPVHSVVADEEYLPFADSSFDLVMSSLSLHWVNDLPGALKEVCRVMKPDSPLVGAMFAGDTLFELRSSLQLAEVEREGGFSPHISPFVQLSDMGSLLTRAGFTMTTIDTDEIQVNYPSMYELMQDLKGMGESNCSWNRRHYIRRSTLTAAAAIYRDMYGGEGRVPATFQLLYFIGWKPHSSQRAAAVRGSATTSLRDLTSQLSPPHTHPSPSNNHSSSRF